MSRVQVEKTYKLYIGGKFPRSESGAVQPVLDADGNVFAQVAWASRKDLRMAVVAARSAQESWAGRTAYNRAQILYRAAEMLEDRRGTFIEQLSVDGRSRDAANDEIDAAVDRLVWYAGWSDKFVQIVGNLNPVAGPYFNITAPEPTGVVGVVAPDDHPLLGLVSVLAPVIVSGNTAVVLPSTSYPLTAASFSEVLATSDVPGGVVNMLTGDQAALTPWLAEHMDVNGLEIAGVPADEVGAVIDAATENLKRVSDHRAEDWYSDDAQSPYQITAYCESKTVWHPKSK